MKKAYIENKMVNTYEYYSIVNTSTLTDILMIICGGSTFVRNRPYVPWSTDKRSRARRIKVL